MKWVVCSKCFCSAYIYYALFIVAVKSIESKTESFGGADREGEDPEQQRLLLQTACGTGQTQTSHVQGEQVIIHRRADSRQQHTLGSEMTFQRRARV